MMRRASALLFIVRLAAATTERGGTAEEVGLTTRPRDYFLGQPGNKNEKKRKSAAIHIVCFARKICKSRLLEGASKLENSNPNKWNNRSGIALGD